MNRRWLSAAGLSSDIEADWRRTASVALAKQYLWTGAARGVDTPVGPRTKEMVERFRVATEGRATWAGYSCCVDIDGVILAGLGLRDERIVNRDDDDLDNVPDDKQQSGRDIWDGPGETHWRVAENMIMFQAGARAAGCWVDALPGRLPCRGDMPEVGGDSPSDGGQPHVFTVVGDLAPAPANVWPKYAKTALVAPTVEGGQVDEGGQCVKGYETIFWSDAKGVMWISRVGHTGARKLKGWIDVTRVTLTAPAQLPDDCEVGRAVEE